MIDLDAIEARANAATPGPWKHEGQEVRAAYHVAFCGEAATSQGATSARDCTRNARFIAHARTDVSALIARVRELEEERDQALADYQDIGRVMHEECSRLEAECERLKTFAAQSFSQMMCQEVEQMREYGLSYEGVRKVLHEYNDGEISFGKLMDLIRAAARAMAEDMQK